MDVSKLPRLSKTETPAPSDPAAEVPPLAAQAPVHPLAYAYGRTYSGRGPEAWLSIGVGLILLFVFPHFTQWWIHAVFHTKNPPSFLPITLEDGTEIPYQKSIFFFNDLAIASFTYALIIEGLALLLAGRGRPGVVLFALVVTAIAVALNAWYLVSSFGDGFPLVSAIAILIGGYMLWFQWNLFKGLIAAARFAAGTRQTQ